MQVTKETIYDALGDATRRRIVELLAKGELAVRAIASSFPVSRPAISRHLRVLREAGLVDEERRGRERIYHLRQAPLATAAAWLEGLLPGVGAPGDPAGAVGTEAQPAVAAPERPALRRRRAPSAGRAAAEAPPPAAESAEEPEAGGDWRTW